MFEFYTFSPGLNIDIFPNCIKPLIPIHLYLKDKHFCIKKGIIDSGVYQLKLRKKYPICFYPFNNNQNLWVIPDYPEDLLQLGNNIELTNKNIEELIKYEKSIPVVQFKIKDFDSFLENFNFILRLDYDNEKIGIGNMCRLLSKEDIKFGIKVLKFLENEKQNFHIFGLGTKLIRKLLELEYNHFSLDSTKFTRLPNIKGYHSSLNFEKNAFLVYYIKYLDMFPRIKFNEQLETEYKILLKNIELKV